MKIRNLRQLDARIYELQQQERREGQVFKEHVSVARHAYSNIELAFYIGKIAVEVFKIWRKPNLSKKSRWKDLIIGILMIAGIYLAQQYLDKLFSQPDED